MANSKKRRVVGFKFQPFSEKQLKLLNWWVEGSPTSDKFMCIADGSVRSGKSTVCTLSFILYTMTHFKEQNMAFCGKTVGSLRRNIIQPLKQMLLTLNYDILEHRSENYLEITKGDITNYYYLFGGRDESSQDLVQGLTLASAFLDEVVLMPESFYNQVLARLSVEGAKVWLSCNPNSPYHWFYTKVLMQLKEKDGIYIHFTMDDNPSLRPEIIARYKKMYSGVWARRFVAGRWSVADGLIYDMFTDEKNVVNSKDIPYDEAIKWCVGVDYGTANATCFLLGMKTFNGEIYIVREYYFEGRTEAHEHGDYENQKSDLEFADDMVEFLGQTYEYTQIPFNKMDIVVDPAAASFKVQLHRSGMRTKDARNAVIDGIRDVASLMSAGKLKVSSDCKNFLKEVHTYSWDETAQARGIDKPLKQNDHCMDACRYLCEKLKDRNKIKDAAKNIGI